MEVELICDRLLDPENKYTKVFREHVVLGNYFPAPIPSFAEFQSWLQQLMGNHQYEVRMDDGLELDAQSFEKLTRNIAPHRLTLFLHRIQPRL